MAQEDLGVKESLTPVNCMTNERRFIRILLDTLENTAVYRVQCPSLSISRGSSVPSQERGTTHDPAII